jgi:hypothetical protein
LANFLIKREDGHFLQVPPNAIELLAATPDFAREDGWGILRLRHLPSGDVLVVDDEMPGLRAWFEGGHLDVAGETRLVAALTEQLAQATGHTLILVPLA